MPKLKPYTVVGFYADSNQPWVDFVASTSAKLAAQRGILNMYNNGENGCEVEDLMVVEVFAGHNKGLLLNQKVSSFETLKRKVV